MELASKHHRGLNATDRRHHNGYLTLDLWHSGFSAASAPEIDQKYPSKGSWESSNWIKYMHTSVDLSSMDSGLRLNACKYLVGKCIFNA